MTGKQSNYSLTLTMTPSGAALMNTVARLCDVLDVQM